MSTRSDRMDELVPALLAQANVGDVCFTQCAAALAYRRGRGGTPVSSDGVG